MKCQPVVFHRSSESELINFADSPSEKRAMGHMKYALLLQYAFCLDPGVLLSNRILSPVTRLDM